MIDSNHTDVAVIGAGPYGLSVAAHLKGLGIGLRIFGTPLQTWREHMPRGMFLKSEGQASSLFEPTGEYSLGRYCAAEGLGYGGYGVPVPLETFNRYALAFQKQFVPDVEDVMVTRLDAGPNGYELELATGEQLAAGAVVVAVGVSHAAHVPAELAGLPAELLTHSSRHADLGRFRGRTVAVIGAGQSAIETAALLHEAGAETTLVARRPALAWNDTPDEGRRSLYQRLRRPMSHLGPGLGPWLYCNAPGMFRHLPRQVRVRKVKTTLGPAGGWWLRPRFEGRVPALLGYSVRGADARGGGAVLHLQALDGGRREVRADHVIAATGYRFAVGSLPFLADGLRRQVRTEGETPLLSAHFESSVPGLYFTGLASANQFGPAMRFLHGAEFTARRLSGHVARRGRRRPVVAAPHLAPGRDGAVPVGQSKA